MKTELKARLELAINRIIEQAAEEESFFDGWIPEDLAVNMTNAAEAVFDANFSVQKFIKENT